ncbi:MAG: class I SAM-dependent methyltransferase [Candidatus Daviesbacteria bacterium]|nr:class I SAM-dependent methyltransferase [Candidatus Daviesbacteria bacterium]
MTIKDGLKLEPTFMIPYYGLKGVEIPDTFRDDLPKFLYERGCRVGIEVGIDQGEYGIKLCKAGLKVYGIDSYTAYKGYKEPESYEDHYEQALANLKGYDYTIIKKFSRDALADFEDGSLDFVYIDGNHTLPYIAADIFGWEPKLRKGGIMSGHDYAFVIGPKERQIPKVYDGTHVKAAVDASAYIMRVEKLYVLGKRVPIKGRSRDKWRSWFWIK